MIKPITIAAVISFACLAALSRQAAGSMILRPADAKWSRGSVPGVDVLGIYECTDKPGRSVTRVRFPPNFPHPPYVHTDERRYTVISGTWYFGPGDRFEDARLIELPAGSFYVESANLPYFAATRAEGAVIQIDAECGSRQRRAEPPRPPDSIK